MAKPPTELAAEILASALSQKSLSGTAEIVAQNYETLYKTILKCRKEELETKVDKPR